MKPFRPHLSTTQIIALGFLCAILLGTLLLTLPCSSASGTATSPADALFTATTSVCVTGLVTVPTYLHWSLFGKIVILILIQLGGLGIISFTTGIMMVIGRKITLKDRILLEDALNLNTLSGLVKFLRKIFLGTFLVETAGAICYSFVFIPRYGLLRGCWYSLFHSVSAFCNAGIDILGDNSLGDYLTHPWMNGVTMTLIILGGLGFLVWWDILKVWKNFHQNHYHPKRFFGRLQLHTKITLTATTALILIGGIAIFLLEHDNPGTIGNLNLFEKVQASFFQSVTTRTAGYATFSQTDLRGSTSMICLMLMFIGGSPIGTAGGIKTTTFILLVLSTITTVKGREHVVVYGRTIPRKTVQKALAVTSVSFLALCLAIILMSVAEPAALLDIAYETTSAIGTVGLSRDFTPHLHMAGKLIIILCMYLGRIGPISLAIIFNSRAKRALIQYPEEDITVG
ncbi:MAG: potassium transporter KtrB [Lachnospiraceae bacterium]|nr:potassium transporter KtrB [Lachnospiraceae bacterium]